MDLNPIIYYNPIIAPDQNPGSAPSSRNVREKKMKFLKEKNEKNIFNKALRVIIINISSNHRRVIIIIMSKWEKNTQKNWATEKEKRTEEERKYKHMEKKTCKKWKFRNKIIFFNIVLVLKNFIVIVNKLL
jgi:hypothetical protein